MGPLASEDFTPDELALIPPDDGEGDRSAEPQPGGQQPPAAAQQVQQPEPPAAEPAAQATPPAAEPPAQPSGDVRAALRAARRSEHRAREEVERLRRENEALKAKAPTEPDPDAISDEEIRQAERVDPLLGKVARLASRAVAAPAAEAPPAQQAEFQPPYLPPVVQEAVDDVPQLLAWQTNPDQTAFRAAIEADRYLQTLPAWKDKPMAERFAAVVARVSQDHGTALPNTPPRSDPRAVIDGVPRQMPNTLSDIGGGAGKQTERSQLEKWQQPGVSDDQILAELALSGD
jgi:hypothetical protein